MEGARGENERGSNLQDDGIRVLQQGKAINLTLASYRGNLGTSNQAISKTEKKKEARISERPIFLLSTSR